MEVPAGMWVILAVGLVLLVVAAVADRRSRRRAEAEQGIAPGRRVPPMSRDLCNRLDQMLAGDRLVLEARLASAQAATHLSPDGTPTAVLENPRIIVCSEPLEGARLVQAILMGNPDGADLTIMAPSFDEFALGVVLANHLNGPHKVIPVVAGTSDQEATTSALGSAPTSLQGIRGGWLPAEVWPRAPLVISDEISTTVVPPPDEQ